MKYKFITEIHIKCTFIRTFKYTYIWFDKNKLTLKNKNIYIVTTHVQCTYICMKNIHMYEQVKFFYESKDKNC